jgi:SAM-dependent methyltransferase
MSSIYICPTTKQPLIQRGNELRTDDRNHCYKIISGWNKCLIPDFITSQEINNPILKALETYNQSFSVEVYRNFLCWLFHTFGEDETLFRKKMIENLRIKEGNVVLVTGCGLGEDLSPILDIVGENGEVYAQDLSSKMVIEASNNIVPRYPNSKIYFSVSDANHLPFPSNFFDGAFHFGGINLFENIKGAISEMERVVKPRGRVVFGDEGVAPWLRETEYGRIAIANNRLWNANTPIELIPENSLDVNLSWVLGNCFYLISFEVSDKPPFMNIDVPHKGIRGGSMRTRYFGQLEGVTEETKKFVVEDAKHRGISVHEWLEEVIMEKQTNNNTKHEEIDIKI